MLDGTPVGTIGLGCMSFVGWYGDTDRDESLATLATAADLGVTHLDTAVRYGDGLSESIIGEYCSGHDNEFFIASKCGIDVTSEGRSFNNRRDYIRAAVEGSLERLRTDRIDLYYLHRRDPEVAIEDAMTYMAELVDEGVIGGIGLSEIAPSTLERAVTVHPVAAVQSEYSLWTRLPELGMIQACARYGTTFVAFSPVGRGALTDAELDPTRLGPNDFRLHNPRFTPENFPANVAHIDRLREYAADHGWSTAALACAWVLAQADHIVTIPGTRTGEHLTELCTATTIELNDNQLDEIEQILPVGFAHGYRYSPAQVVGTEQYC